MMRTSRLPIQRLLTLWLHCGLSWRLLTTRAFTTAERTMPAQTRTARATSKTSHSRQSSTHSDWASKLETLATGEKLSLRELLDDNLSDQWAEQSRTGLKLDEEFLFGANAILEYIPLREGDGVMRFRIAMDRFK
jgi:hypothetical protein